ncbi:hypothetical protein J007_02485, partial [Cryptococcus neoformans]
MEMADDSWYEITGETVENCWKKVKWAHPRAEEEVMEVDEDGEQICPSAGKEDVSLLEKAIDEAIARRLIRPIDHVAAAELVNPLSEHALAHHTLSNLMVEEVIDLCSKEDKLSQMVDDCHPEPERLEQTPDPPFTAAQTLRTVRDMRKVSLDWNRGGEDEGLLRMAEKCVKKMEWETQAAYNASLKTTRVSDYFKKTEVEEAQRE